MFGVKTVKEQLHEARRENARIRAEFDKTAADIEYIAMMSDIELDMEEMEVTEDER